MASTTPWLIISFIIIILIVAVLIRVSRLMDFSRTFFERWRKDDRGDEGGVFTSYTFQEKAAMGAERHRLGRTSIPESGLRADLPPGTAREVNRKIRDGQTRDRTEPPVGREPEAEI